MTDVKDIVKRLRGDTLDKYPGFVSIYTEAADTIETLAEEVRAARAWENTYPVDGESALNARERLDAARADTDAKIKGIV